jgi:hypothetical protein
MAVGIIVPVGSASGQSAANALSVPQHRPANVPNEYVTTPFGYFHPSCVQRLAKEERLLSNGRVQRADGSVDENAATCNYMRYTSKGVPIVKGSSVAPNSTTAPEVNGWIENASITTSSESKSYGALVATWTVPPHPTANDGQWLFFFPGFEDIGNTPSILQPVLQWNQHQWAIASWNCCLNDITTESPVVNVSPGDLIYGSITSNCPRGSVSCSAWNVLSLDMSTGQSTILSDTPSEGQVFNWAFGGVLEPYYVVSCNDYPPNRKILFDNIAVFDQSLRPMAHPKWGETANTTQTPQCGYGATASGNQVKLTY